MTEQKLTKKGQLTRQRIIQTAADLMFINGVAGTSIDDVQKQAEVSASQLYHYFDNKDELVLAVIDHQTTQILNEQEPFLSQLDSMAALRGWRDLILGLQIERNCQGGCPIGSLGSELAESNPLARDEVAAGLLKWETAILAGLQAMYDRGELKQAANPAELALALLTTLQGGLLMTKIQRNTHALATSLDTMLAHIESFVIV